MDDKVEQAWMVCAWGILIGLVRIFLTPGMEPEPLSWVGSYQAAAHLFTGGLFVGWYIQRRWWQWVLFWVLCFVEVACAVLART